VSHDTDKLIRQLSLVAYLMAERRLLTARDVKSNVEGYSEMSDEAFARRYYSDRAELTALGVPLASQRDEFTEFVTSIEEEVPACRRRLALLCRVPAEPSQLEAVGGDAGRYDREVRPGLMVRTIEDVQAGGVEPDIWKIEGIDAREDCERIAATARRDGRDRVACVVLGRGANEEAVIHWLQQGAGVPGYIGFAIGRTIWWDALKAYLDGETSREAAAKTIGENYRRMIEVYSAGA